MKGEIIMKKTRIIAAALSAITVFSAAGMSLSTASAAEFHRVHPSHVRLLEENNISTESGRSASEIAKYISTTVFKKVLEKVGKTGMPASLVCDGLSFLMDLSDYLDGKTKVNPDVEKLMNAINEVSKKMDQYHDDEMRKLVLINSNIDTQKFREQIDSIVLDYIHANKKIGEQSCNISTSGDKVIDEKTYQAFSEIINDKTCDSSQLQKNLEHMEQFALGNTRVTSGKNGFEAYTEYLIAKINDLNADHNFAKCADFTAASEYINNEMDSIAASCVLDYITMLTIKKMEFKVRQYENRDISGSCQKFIDNITESITKIMDSYAQAKEKSMKALQAQVMIGDEIKGFSSLSDAWAAAYKSGQDFTIRLCRDIDADAARGFNLSQLNDKYGFNTTQGFIVPEGREVTVDLNGHTIDCSAFGGIKLFDVQKGAIFTLQNGQVNSAASAINYSSHDKAKTGICVEDVKINHCSGTAIFFDGSNPSDNLTIKNCMISGSQKGGMVWKWRLKYMISYTTFADNHAEYGAAIKGIYAEDGSFVRNCKFTGNTADKAAGALYCVSGVSNCTFENNKAGTYGGACAGWTEVSNSTFIGNSAGSDGGAVWTQNDVINCTFKNNKAGGEGGAVYVQPRLQTIRNCTFENNHAFKGGALTFELDGSKAVNCTFRNNSADSDGGALFIRSNEDGTVSGCVFDGNKAGVDGGAICASCHAKLMADNTTITGNRAGCNGGGIYLGALTTSNHHLTNVTITGNSANHGGGIYCSAGAFKAADTCLHGIVNIKDNNGDNVYLVNDSGKKALLYTKGDFDRSNSTVYVSSSSRSDIAVVDLDSKSHESSFHADYGRRLYRGTMCNGTLYLDDM